MSCGGGPEGVTVVFIAGVGRSGSTLLDACLNEVGGLATVGELCHLWDNGFRQNLLCGCGRPFLECETWGAIRARAFPGGVDLDRFAEDRRAVERWRHLPRLLHPGLRGDGFRLRLQRHGGRLHALLAAAREVHGAAAVIDSSKNPVHGLILAQVPGIDLRVLHLVRDPRATTFSRRRLRRRPEVTGTVSHMPRQPVLVSALEWVFLNRLAERMAAAARRSIRVRYEDFAAAPRRTFEEIRAALGLPGTGSPFIDERRVRLGTNHSVAGNPVRFRQGEVEIAVDEEWRTALAPADRTVVELVTGRLAARYGFAP